MLPERTLVPPAVLLAGTDGMKGQWASNNQPNCHFINTAK